MATYFSNDEETFNYDSVDEAVEALISESSDIKVGDFVSVYSGESESVSVKAYVPDVMELIGEMAYDDMGEFADSFPDSSREVDKEIQDAVESLVADLFDKHKLNPSFYKVKNQKCIEVRIDNVDDISFEIISTK